jgi:hypothetical protein
MRDTPVRCAPVRYTLMRHTPIRYTPVRYTPVRYTPMRHPPIRCTLVGCMPVRYVSIFENGFVVLDAEPGLARMSVLATAVSAQPVQKPETNPRTLCKDPVAKASSIRLLPGWQD